MSLLILSICQGHWRERILAVYAQLLKKLSMENCHTLFPKKEVCEGQKGGKLGIVRGRSFGH
jgi:hypothetical protein